MVVPWQLIGRLVAALAVGVVALLVVGARRQRLNAAVDVVLTLVVGAVVGGRLMVLALDAALLGSLPDPRALLTLGPGLSVPGAVIGATVAGWRRRAVVPVPVWTDAAVAIAAGLGAFAAVHLPGGLVANLLRVVAFGAGAAWLWRSDPARWHPGLRLLAVVSTVHLVSTALTPSLPTVDTDIDVVLTLVVCVAALLTHPRVGAGMRRGGSVAAGVLAGIVVLSAVLTVPSGLALSDMALPEGGGDASLVGAIVADGAAADVPAWGGAELAAFVDQQDVPVVVNLWASWCPPCHAEAATLARAARALDGRAVVLGVLVDDDAADGQAFADRYGLGFPTVVDAGVSDALGMAGLPTTVVLDPDGEVVQRVVGGLSQATLADAVARAGATG